MKTLAKPSNITAKEGQELAAAMNNLSTQMLPIWNNIIEREGEIIPRLKEAKKVAKKLMLESIKLQKALVGANDRETMKALKEDYLTIDKLITKMQTYFESIN